MNKKTSFNIVILLSTLVFLVGCERQVSFQQDVEPILTSSCVTCHKGEGEGIKASGFNVSTYDSIMKGTKYGPVVVSGSSASSTLYRLISQKADPKIQMPPHHATSLAKGRKEALSSSQVETIKTWIDQGAKNN